MKNGNIDFIYKNELDKACFQHDMAYGKLKDLAKKTQSDKVLRFKAFKIASDPKYDGYQRGLSSMIYNFLIKNLVEVKRHRQIIRKFNRRKVHSSSRDKIWGDELANMQSLNKYNKGIKYFLCAINLFSKYAWLFL